MARPHPAPVGVEQQNETEQRTEHEHRGRDADARKTRPAVRIRAARRFGIDLGIRHHEPRVVGRPRQDRNRAEARYGLTPGRHTSI